LGPSHIALRPSVSGWPGLLRHPARKALGERPSHVERAVSRCGESSKQLFGCRLTWDLIGAAGDCLPELGGRPFLGTWRRGWLPGRGSLSDARLGHRDADRSPVQVSRLGKQVRTCALGVERASAFVVRSKDLQSVFKGNFIDGTRYANNEAAPVSKSSSSSRGHAMSRIELHKRDANGDPVPTFATDAEIQAAEQLRHQLEEQYLTPRWASAPLSKGSDERQHR